MALEDLRHNEMMSHLLDAQERGEDVGHYGRLTFAMIARHFLPEEEVVARLAAGGDCDELKAKALVQQVAARDYSPPRAQKIQQWQKEQDFPICPSHDPDGCNVYRNLKFPDGVYQHIEGYREEKVAAQEA